MGDRLTEALDEARRRYADKRPRSRELAARAAAVLPGGNTRSVLHIDPFPFRVVGADGEWAAGPYEADVVDAFGGGDAAVGAFLAALLRDDGVAEAARRSAWACALQHTFTGDAWQGRESDLAPADATPGRILR